MLIIGEKINALDPLICKSLLSGDLSTIVRFAILQVEAGANLLDINIGPDIIRGETTMQEVVTAVQRHVDVPLCLNGTPEMLDAGLRAHKGKAMINGVTGERERMKRLLLLAREHNADVIGMTIPEKGHEQEADGKCSIAMEIIEEAKSYGINSSGIFLDPVMPPFLVRPDAVSEAGRTILMFKELFPGIKTIIGLNNLSLGIKKGNRSVINSTELGILAGAGLDAAILNPMDRLVMRTAKTANLLCGGGLYCDDYLCA